MDYYITQPYELVAKASRFQSSGGKTGLTTFVQLGVTSLSSLVRGSPSGGGPAIHNNLGHNNFSRSSSRVIGIVGEVQ